MDWKRAKAILILMFFILNIVLSVSLYQNLKGDDISDKTINNTKNILKQNNVLIECPIPKRVERDYMLQYDENVLDQEKQEKIAAELLEANYEKTGNNTYKNGTMSLVFNSESGFEFNDTGEKMKIYSDSKSGVDLCLKDLSKKIGIPFDQFKQDTYYIDVKADNGTRVVYKGEYKGYPVFDNYIEVVVKNASIKSIKYEYKNPMNITARDINVIPVYEILITKMTAYPGIKIQAIDMGFRGYTKVDKETKTLYEGLSWRIKTYDGSKYAEYYFKASNGDKME